MLLVLVNDTWAKWGFGEFLEYFGGYNGQFWSDSLQTWFVYLTNWPKWPSIGTK